MIKHRYILVYFLFFVSWSCLGQTKSTNVQTIDGKKFYIHKIEKGQSLYAISKTYNVTLEEIYKVNPELKTAGIKANQDVRIPFATTYTTAVSGTVSLNTFTNTQIDTNKYLTHKVLKSETVYSITRKYAITEKQLAAYNPGITPSLKEGQIIIVGEKFKRKPSVKDPKENKQISTAKEKDTKTNVPIFDSTFLKPVAKPRKSNYNVAVILPFRLEQTLALDLNELVKTNSGFPNVPALAVDFYMGFKRAADSLAAKDFSVNIELYESDDKDSVKLMQILDDPKFKNLDFIFGPLYANGFKTIAKKAKEFNIPIVSPITQQNKILYDNIYISKTNPSQFTMLEGLADYCIDSLVSGNANIILMLLSDKDKKELAFVNDFKKYYNEKQRSLGKLPKDTVTLVRGTTALKTAFKPDAKNIVVTLSTNQVFMTDFTTQLAMLGDKKDIIVLCGWQSLTETDNIDQEYLNQLHYTFPHQFNLTNLGAYNTITKSYLEQLQTIPDEYYYIGFDVAWYYLKNLKENGPDFIHNLNNLPLETNYMRFKYTRPDNTTGFDNRGLYIFRYNDYKLYKTGWK